MTFAAWVTETVGSPDVAMAGELWAALTFGSLPCVANSPDGAAEGGVDSVLLGDGRSAVASFGGTSAADGGTEPTDAVAEALAVADGEDDGACVARLGVVAVDVTVGDSEFGATARGACDSTFVTVGAEVAVGDAGATTAVVVAVTGAGATGSIGCGATRAAPAAPAADATTSESISASRSWRVTAGLSSWWSSSS